MPAISAGMLMYRIRDGRTEVLLAHPGGPYWQNKDAGAWMIPKGLADPGEELIDAAAREFGEETGLTARGPFIELGTIKQKSGKIVHAWAFEGDADPAAITSNTCEVEWPPRSGKRITIPEVDRAAFFGLDEARVKIREAQSPFLDRLAKTLPH